MDTEEDGQWMTYAELGQARGISKESALKLALRRKWRKQDDNRGQVRVCVPMEWIGSRDIGVDTRADLSRTIQTAFGMLQEHFKREIERSEAQAVEIVALREQAIALREAAARAVASQDEADALHRAALDKAEAEIATLRQAEAVRRARPLIARLRAAWRGD